MSVYLPFIFQGSGKVVCAKFTAQCLNEDGLKDLIKPFGEVVKIIMFPALAFVEMGSTDQATDIVTYYLSNPVMVKGGQATFSVSSTFNFLQSSRVLRFTPVPSGKESVPWKRELLAVAKRFGPVEQSLFLPTQAFVEMTNALDAQKLVGHHTSKHLKIDEIHIKVAFSSEYNTLPSPRKQSSSRSSRSPCRPRFPSKQSSSRTSRSPRSHTKERFSSEKKTPGSGKTDPKKDKVSPTSTRSQSPTKDKTPSQSSTVMEKSEEAVDKTDQRKKKTETQEDGATEAWDMDSDIEGVEVIGEDSDIEGMAVYGEDGEENSDMGEEEEGPVGEEEVGEAEVVEGEEEEVEEEEEEESEEGGELEEVVEKQEEEQVGEEEVGEAEVVEGEEEEVEEEEEEESEEGGELEEVVEKQEEEQVGEEEEDEEEEVGEEEKGEKQQESAEDLIQDLSATGSEQGKVFSATVSEQGKKRDGEDQKTDASYVDEVKFMSLTCSSSVHLSQPHVCKMFSFQPSGRDQTPGRVIFVKNLPRGFYTDSDFLEIVKGFGRVHRYFLLRNGEEGFIEMEKSSDATKALRELRYDGCKLYEEDEETKEEDEETKEEDEETKEEDEETKEEDEETTRQIHSEQEFIKPVMGYFCNLCQVIYVNEDEAKNQHCSSLCHYLKFMEHSGKDTASS
uniref:Matrin-3-like n=1 Tax=Salmo trutta TaxID=8032 RepID=A0A673ZZB8_SALTR